MKRAGRLHPDYRVTATLGVASLVAGWYLLHDAYMARGRKPPLALRPFLWWR